MHIRQVLYTLVATPLLLSCSSYLEERSQDTYYVTSYNDLDELLIGDCYLPVRPATELAFTKDPAYFIHYLADEIEEQNGGLDSWSSNNKEAIFGYYTWQQRVGETDKHNGYLSENSSWTEIYRLINVANNIIESSKGVSQTTEEEKTAVRRIRGEAHFLRAAYYFWLVNLYGKPFQRNTAATDLGVPIKTKAKVNDIIYQRHTVQEVYDQVLADLKQAEADLSTTPKKPTLYRADITAVHLLLSRVYLYMQDWNLAKTYADKVLKVKSELINLNQHQGPFLSKSSVENIFSMGGAEIPCSMCNYYQSFRVSHDLYNAYGADDLRKTSFWWKNDDFVGYIKMEIPSSVEVDANSKSFYERRYHQTSYNKRAAVSDHFLFRTAEAYLNKAEAEACLGNEAESRKLLHTLYTHRYTQGQGYASGIGGADLLRAIRHERRLELALEGHRWFDLRRYSVSEKLPESKRIVHDYTYYERHTTMKERHRFVLEPFDAAYTLPIPHEVIDFNIGMPNNERPARQHTIVPIGAI